MHLTVVLCPLRLNGLEQHPLHHAHWLFAYRAISRNAALLLTIQLRSCDQISVRFVKKNHWGLADRREGRGAAGTNM